jgi:hypothetical protein
MLIAAHAGHAVDHGYRLLQSCVHVNRVQNQPRELRIGSLIASGGARVQISHMAWTKVDYCYGMYD